MTPANKTTSLSSLKEMQYDREKLSTKQVMENVESALAVVQDNCLGQLYATFPGQNSWEAYYVFFQNSQLHFLGSIKNHAFKYCYIIHKIQSRMS
jgi:hypothetical protein